MEYEVEAAAEVEASVWLAAEDEAAAAAVARQISNCAYKSSPPF